MQLADAIARFQVQLRADGRSPHTVAQYARHIRLLASWAAQESRCCDIAAFEPDDLARFLASADALQRPDGRALGAGSMNALRTSVPRNPAHALRMARVGVAPPKGLWPSSSSPRAARGAGPEGALVGSGL